MSVLDDQYLRLRLSAEPEFILRLYEFSQMYGFAELPALVLQARPFDEIAGFNIKDAATQQRFVDGVQSNSRWWNGLRSRTGATMTFNGIASLGSSDRPEWASELHRDGHFIAGTWAFPPASRNIGTDARTAIFDFYAGMFSDFLAVVKNVVAADVRFQTTATLVNAPQLHFSTTPNNWGEHILRSPMSLPNLQWPIFTGSTGTEWGAVASRLAAPLLGACGISPAEST